jgi:cytoplasmic iron level regulating protein YaaA (DUF328/UPF0246 family)
MIILLHTSKTMRSPEDGTAALYGPALLDKAGPLAAYIQSLSSSQLMRCMHLSPGLAEKTYELFQNWNLAPERQRPAIDSFIGDIYSGLQVPTWSVKDREYAHDTLRILSGLYGIVRPLDGVFPYRLEMGYILPEQQFENLYRYWDEAIVRTLPASGSLINLAAIEYSKVVTPYVDPSRITTPAFLTRNPKTNEPTFVVVHAKIARGAFAAWLIKQHITDQSQLETFSELGYVYDRGLSQPQAPVFVCDSFGGLGLSVRLK